MRCEIPRFGVCYQTMKRSLVRRVGENFEDGILGFKKLFLRF